MTDDENMTNDENVRSLEWGGSWWYYPRTIEGMMSSIGSKEKNRMIEIVMTSELVADLCTRLIRLESAYDADYDEEDYDEEDGDWS